MTALEMVVAKLIRRVEAARCFDTEGLIVEKDKFHEIMDLPCLHVCLVDLQGGAFCYGNSRFASKAGISAGWVRDEDLYLYGQVFDPMSFQRFFSEMDRYAQGSLHPQPGFMSLLDSEEKPPTICEDLSALVARSRGGRNTYYAHFFHEADLSERLAAHALFELESLTPRQTEAMAHLISGAGTETIAHKMGISPKTLEKYCHVIFDLTGCQNQAALIAAVREL